MTYATYALPQRVPQWGHTTWALPGHCVAGRRVAGRRVAGRRGEGVAGRASRGHTPFDGFLAHSPDRISDYVIRNSEFSPAGVFIRPICPI